MEQITGELEQLQGGYAKVSGYHYAVPPCTSGTCDTQVPARRCRPEAARQPALPPPDCAHSLAPRPLAAAHPRPLCLQDLSKLAAALEQTPVSICVNAGVWNDYVGGVMTAKACGPSGAAYQDHCVMATGFNATAPVPYWIVRNSWASTWGDEGYIYLEMAKNTCGLADDVTVPEVSVDLSDSEKAEAAVRREAMYQRATMAP